MAFTNLSRNDVQFVCRNLTPKLTKLSLAGCRDNLDNCDVKELVTKCNRLQVLDLSDAKQIDDLAVTYITQHLSSTLRKLSLSRCFDIHPAQLVSLNAMKELKYLNVFGLLIPDKVEVLKKRLPRLSINDDPLCYIARSSNGEKKNQLWDIKLWQ